MMRRESAIAMSLR